MARVEDMQQSRTRPAGRDASAVPGTCAGNMMEMILSLTAFWTQETGGSQSSRTTIDGCRIDMYMLMFGQRQPTTL